VFKSFDVAAMPLEGMIGREWLATNGVGGYASSTIPCLNTRKYHGLLVAAMAPPVRRMVLLSRTEESVHCDGWPHALSSSEYPGTFHPEGYRALRAFSAEPFPRWAFQADNWTLQKELCLLRGRNTVCLTYTLLAGKRPATLEVRPLLALRPIHELSYQWNGKLAAEARGPNGHRVPATTRTPEVFFAHTGAFEAEPNWYLNTIYRREQERGYAGLEDVWCPGVVRFPLQAGQSVHFVCSSDPIDLEACVELAEQQGATASRRATVVGPATSGTSTSPSMAPTPVPSEAADRPGLPTVPATSAPLPAAAAIAAAVPRAVSQGVAQDQVLADLARAAEQFLAQVPAAAGADNSGGESAAGTAVIGQFPWAPPSGRSGLAGFAGLFLATGRFAEGRALLISMASHLDQGLMPSEFAETGAAAPVYQGADVALWFVNAAYAYLRYTGDEATVSRHLLDPVLSILANYRRGTRLGISADADGLLRTGEPGTPTTWMDAKIGDWVITPRQGRPVELNALWHNAVCTGAELATRFGRLSAADELGSLAYSVKLAFNRRFWNDPAGCCYDVVADRGNDSSVRPNQLLAMSLLFPVLSLDRHSAALERVMRDLVTPFGVRTLAPQEPAYCGRYGGNVIARDRAVHCGPAFPWLLGPLVTAYLRVHGRGEGARREAAALLQPCIGHLRGDGVGQLPELFDGDSPQYPGGAVASALSVAEVLRAYAEDVLDRAPAVPPGCGSCATGIPAGVAVTATGNASAPAGPRG
jgi:glycogen debranching enzyme